MNKIVVDMVQMGEKYVVSNTENNMNALLNADYTKPTLIKLEYNVNGNAGIVGIISTKIQGFYTKDSANNDLDDSDSDESELDKCDFSEGMSAEFFRRNGGFW